VPTGFLGHQENPHLLTFGEGEEGRGLDIGGGAVEDTVEKIG
jgi:hypothetical protein